MQPSDMLPGLNDPSPCFVCENLAQRGAPQRYRVPLINSRVDAFNLDKPDLSAGKQALDALPDIGSAHQLRALLQASAGLGLWAPKLPEKNHIDAQLAAGSLIIFPPAEWEFLREEFANWLFDGVEAAFDGLPYSFDDVIPFAGPNFTPDRWLLVLRGSMAGNVCWWTHDGDIVMNEPWALDIKAWGAKIFEQTPDVLGGVIRFSARHSADPAPSGAELYPLEYRADGMA